MFHPDSAAISPQKNISFISYFSHSSYIVLLFLSKNPDLSTFKFAINLLKSSFDIPHLTLKSIFVDIVISSIFLYFFTACGILLSFSVLLTSDLDVTFCNLFSSELGSNSSFLFSSIFDVTFSVLS